MDKPRKVAKPDWSRVTKAVEAYIDDVYSDDYCDDNDHSNWVFEAAVEAVYGQGVFEKHINQRL